jgi:hypothetical protein
MPKIRVTGLITEQEMAFAHLVLSGTMNDRQAAEAVGLNPDTVAYTRSKPLGTGQSQSRFNQGIVAGQTKALSMIVAIEGLIPDRRLAPTETQPTAPPVKAQIYNSEWRREQQREPVGEEPRDAVADTKTPAMMPQTPTGATPEPTQELANGISSPNLSRPQLRVANPFIDPERRNWVPDPTNRVFDAILDTSRSLRLSFSSEKGFSGRRRQRASISQTPQPSYSGSCPENRAGAGDHFILCGSHGGGRV